MALEERVRVLEDTVAALVAGRSEFDSSVGTALYRLASLPENWDSEGAHPIAAEILDAARELINKLPSRLKSRLPVPAIVPMREGNLQFEWHDGPRTLELEIEDPHTVHYLKWHAEAGIEEENVCPISDVHTIVDLLEWFAKG